MSNIHMDKWFILLFTMPWILLILFLICNSGGYASGAFGKIDIYEQCEWYRFPAKVQRMLPMIITICHKRTVVQGFGNISCTRETYGTVNLERNFIKSNYSRAKSLFLRLLQVVNNAFSYFVMLRKLLS